MKKKDIYILLVFALSRLTDDAYSPVNDALLARLTPERGQALAIGTKKALHLNGGKRGSGEPLVQRIGSGSD
jgi:hypothetical protein